MYLKNMNLKLNADYISNDEIVKKQVMEAIEMNDVILLVAPQGTGKSEFLKSLTRYTKLFISPTISTAQQVEDSTDSVVTRGRSIYTFSISGAIDRFNDPLTDITSSTFGSADGIVNNALVDDYDVLIVDEVHKLVQYSTFGYNNISSAINTIKEFIERGKKVIFTTATANLMYCLTESEDFPKVDIAINIEVDKSYISECIVLNKESRELNKTLENLIIENKEENNFQIVLYNSRDGIKRIAHALQKEDINALSVNADEYQKNGDKQKLVKDFKVGIYHGYSVLLATSWIDVGLNFNGDNITHLYCIFDSYYSNGDLTIIKQFMARARNSYPKLYINKPELSPQEKVLFDRILDKDESTVKYDLEKLAYEIIENYEKGNIREIECNHYYGLYQKSINEYDFSMITLNYQLEKIYEKIRLLSDLETGLKQFLNVDIVYIKPREPDELTNDEYVKLNSFAESAEENATWYSVKDICNFIARITDNRIIRDRPKKFMNKNLDGYKLQDKNKSINGHSVKGYLIVKV